MQPATALNMRLGVSKTSASSENAVAKNKKKSIMGICTAKPITDCGFYPRLREFKVFIQGSVPDPLSVEQVDR